MMTVTAKAKTPARTSARAAAADLPAYPWAIPASTTEERLQRIAALGQRVGAHVRFMGQVGGLVGTSAEAKDSAVKAFYNRLVAAEGQLDRILENLRLG
jgi:hypothetical protein